MINKCVDYKIHYNRLIERARNRIIDGYTEKHRIIPGCLGGIYTKKNVVLLTPEEHYVAHQLLVKIYPEEPKLIYAAKMMTVESKCHERQGNKLYGWLRKRYVAECRKRVGKKNSSYGRGWYYNPNTLESRKFLKEDVPAGWKKGRILDADAYVKRQELRTQKKIEQQQRKKEREELAKKLFMIYVEGNYSSMLDFIRSGRYEGSRESLRVLWKEYIPEYENIFSTGIGSTKYFKNIARV